MDSDGADPQPTPEEAAIVWPEYIEVVADERYPEPRPCKLRFSWEAEE